MSAAGGLAATPIPGHRATKLPGRKPCAVVLADRSIQDVSGNLTSPVSATYLTTRPVAAAHPHKVPAQRQQAVPSGRRPSVSRGDDYRPRKSALTLPPGSHWLRCWHRLYRLVLAHALCLYGVSTAYRAHILA